jgi:hypothetical protein
MLKNSQASLKAFLNQEISGRELYERYKNTDVGGEVRNLLRGGVTRARDITRKALKYGSLQSS